MKQNKKIDEIVKRKKIRIVRDDSRVITRPHIPGEVQRIDNIIKRVMALDEVRASELLSQIHAQFSDRHKNIDAQFYENFDRVADYMADVSKLSITQKKIIGAYFTMEYSIESAALFNPSMIPHPNQKGMPKGHLRFITSFRATGEGHISSIVFRTGTIENDSVLFDPVSEFVETHSILHDPVYDAGLFALKLKELKAWDATSQKVLELIPNSFTYQELKVSIGVISMDPGFEVNDHSINMLYWLANSNYTLCFSKNSKVSERVIFPVSENESGGIEDARFVKFFDDNGESTYYATYTAYDRYSILSQLIETKDFRQFNMITLNGRGVQNKGMALFPRKINGKYAMLSRQDGENNYIMFSDHLHFWHEYSLIQEPAEPWEFIQVGNCGSPLETSEGWLVITHGVGPVRQYSIGAILLDLDDPTKVIARLEEPLLKPTESEREGYVPNVMYSCGGLIHHNKLVLPYAMSDTSSGIAMVEVSDLLSCMKYYT
ncbi:glycoside hydrolase family 130 protein [Saccharicrinis fermentans]|uniref:Beta-1,4-mannooligosaccharide phosphorylase n=1 Tax=Saccharicrinis fermentans DSM 9555 = JCM 21142 TaxID=869213 RepID=W7Y7N0_9BACT|nr:glycoside hydrolase family 130 protein [Saccharicrinis fermentans]GAF03668.1 hypothetical protein JCM21142_52347 [Saccharicrinis fermentans DSM 9555 = JCM 21142]